MLKRLFKRKRYFIVVWLCIDNGNYMTGTMGYTCMRGEYPDMADITKTAGHRSIHITNIIELNKKDFSDYFKSNL